MSSGPKLLLEWEPRWHAFKTALRPAMSRSPRHGGQHGGLRLDIETEPAWQAFRDSIRPALSRSAPQAAGECHASLRPGRGTLLSFALHILGLLLVIFAVEAGVPRKTGNSVAELSRRYDVIYYSGELPQLQDAAGAQAGSSGRAGGGESLNRSQTIRIARGEPLVATVADAGKLELPQLEAAVANLLAWSAPIPGPPPAERVPSARSLTGVVPQAAPVPPPPGVARDKLARNLPLAPVVEVVPPPVAIPASEIASSRLHLPAPVAVQPAPANIARDINRVRVPGMGAANSVVPATPDVLNASVISRPAAALGRDKGIGSAAAVLAPPPGNRAGSGDGRSSTSAGGANGQTAGLVVSTAPGGATGVPKTATTGSLAMSLSGASKPGLGGSGGGAGIGSGTGPGSGASGTGPGSATSATGLGNDAAAHSGTSLAAAPGGAGGGGSPAVAGIVVRGGSVTLPSFGPPSSGPASPAHGPAEPGRRAPGVTVVATSRSGGALNAYGELQGGRIYTIYMDTRQGLAVMEFSDRSASQGFEADLTAPEPVRYELPADLPKSRVVIACQMDRSGLLQNMRVLQAASNELASRVMTALHDWRFRPVLRGSEAIAVDAILGFNIDTR